MRCGAGIQVCCLSLVVIAVAAGCGERPEWAESRALRFLEGEEIDLGVVPGKSRSVFTLLNASDKTRRITHISTSCGCAAAILQGKSRVIPPGGRCAIDFTLTVGAGRRRRTSLTVLTADGGVAVIDIAAEGRVSQWRAHRTRVDLGCIWLGDEGSARIRVESRTALPASEDPPDAHWTCRDSSRVYLEVGDLVRRPQGNYDALCTVRVVPTHLGSYSATVMCEVEGAVVPIALSWRVASPLGLASHQIRAPSVSSPVSIPLAIPQGLSLIRAESARSAADIDCVVDGGAAERQGPTLTIRRHANPDDRAPLGVREIAVAMKDALRGHQFTSPLTVLFTE